jgi:uncharacterized membrane protein (UPF0127 family)
MRLTVLWMFAILLGCGQKGDPVADIAAKQVTLPDGAKILAEMKLDPASQAVGMMYRDSLPKDRGMLFYQAKPVQVPYWMHNVKIPLDIIFLDAHKKVVEIAADAQPCLKPPQQCPTYGGHAPSQYVLELNGGEARRHGITTGSLLTF